MMDPTSFSSYNVPNPHREDTNLSPETYHALKAAVIVMGILLLAGMIFVFSTIVYRVFHPRSSHLVYGQQPEYLSYEKDVEVPVGSVVGSIVVSQGVLLLEIKAPAGATQFLLYDVVQGRRLGQLNLIEK